MFALINGKSFWDAVCIFRVIIPPSRFKFLQLNGVRAIAVDFIGRHMNKWRIWASLPARFEKIESAHRINIEIVKWNRCGLVVRGPAAVHIDQA